MRYECLSLKMERFPCTFPNKDTARGGKELRGEKVTQRSQFTHLGVPWNVRVI